MQARSATIGRPSGGVGQGLQLQIQTTLLRDNVEGETPRQISLLVNAVYFFIETVFILKLSDGYRLIAIHNNTLLCDGTYKTPKGAKIAFNKRYSYKAWKKGVKPDWTPFYSPNTGVGPLYKYEELDKENE